MTLKSDLVFPIECGKESRNNKVEMTPNFSAQFTRFQSTKLQKFAQRVTNRLIVQFGTTFQSPRRKKDLFFHYF